jgi:CheY-like chemotaxis protein
MAKTLLLADNSVTIQRVVELTFAHEDVRVVAMSDGRKALQWLESERPDIVLVDVDLPETDGYAFTQHVKTTPRLRHTPVLLMAGAFEPIDHDRARAIGCDGVIVKPFEPQHVVTRVKELFAESAAMAHAAREQARREPAPAPTGPSNSPSLAVLKAAATRGPDGRDTPRGRTEPTPLRPEPYLRGVASSTPAAPAAPVDVPSPTGAPEPLEMPTRPIWDPGAGAAELPRVPAGIAVPPVAPPIPAPLAPAPLAASRQAPSPVLPVIPVAPAPVPPAPKVTLASAFTALLAAEQSAAPAAPAAAPPAALSEATIEEAVKRVLVRMTDDLVRRIVVDTAERMIREEIDRIKETEG